MSVIKQIAIYNGTNWTSQKYSLGSIDSLITISYSYQNSEHPGITYSYNNIEDLFYDLLPTSKLSSNKLIYIDVSYQLITTTTTTAQISTALTGLNYNLNNKLTTLQNIQSKLNNKSLLDWTYPIGAIYLARTVQNINPRSCFGGTWQQISNKMLVSKGYNFTTAGSAGGNSTITLTTSQLPRIIDSFGVRGWGTSGSNLVDTATGIFSSKRYSDSSYPLTGTATNGSYKRSDRLTFTLGVASPSAIEIMPPYIVVDMWERIS